MGYFNGYNYTITLIRPPLVDHGWISSWGFYKAMEINGDLMGFNGIIIHLIEYTRPGNLVI